MKCPNCTKGGLYPRDRDVLDQLVCDECGECYRNEDGKLILVDPEIEDDAAMIGNLVDQL